MSIRRTCAAALNRLRSRQECSHIQACLTDGPAMHALARLGLAQRRRASQSLPRHPMEPSALSARLRGTRTCNKLLPVKPLGVLRSTESVMKPRARLSRWMHCGTRRTPSPSVLPKGGGQDQATNIGITARRSQPAVRSACPSAGLSRGSRRPASERSDKRALSRRPSWLSLWSPVSHPLPLGPG